MIKYWKNLDKKRKIAISYLLTLYLISAVIPPLFIGITCIVLAIGIVFAVITLCGFTDY